MEGKLLTLKNILSKPPLLRSSEDLKEIASHISNIKFLSTFKEDKQVLNECCVYITYEFFEENQYVFHIGDIGDKFYIMIEGEASALVPGEANDENGMNEVFIYKTGSSFGELALTEKKPRSATILTKAPCHFAVLDKQSYQRILSGIMKRKKLEIVEFLQKQAIFKKLTKGSLVKLSYSFEEKTYKKDHTLFSEDNTLSHLYLIKDGEITLSKRLLFEKLDYESTNKYKAQLNKSFRQQVEISTVGPGEFLGLYDLETEIYSATAICTSLKVNVLRISLTDFKKRIQTQECINFISESKRLKEVIHEENINGLVKVIQDKESSPYRKFCLKLDKEMKHEIGMTSIINNSFMSPVSIYNKGSSLLTRTKRHADVAGLMKYEVKIDKNRKPRSSSHLYIKMLRKITNHSRNTNDENIRVNRSSLALTNGYYPDDTKTTLASLFSILEPFGRMQSPKRRKPSEHINIHTKQLRLKKFSLAPTNKSFRIFKKSSP